MNQTIELIQTLVRERFYGAVTIKFEAGRVVIIKKEETIRPSTKSAKLPEKPGKSDHDENKQQQKAL
jgi:hypothetical protein